MAKTPFLLHYRISNTPGTKFIKLGLKCSFLHFEMDKTIKFERIFFSLEPFLESLQEVHVKYVTFVFISSPVSQLNLHPQVDCTDCTIYYVSGDWRIKKIRGTTPQKPQKKID